MDKQPLPLPDMYSLPRIQQGVIDTFAAQNHDFDQEWNELKQKQPNLAAFLMSRAEALAPRDVRNKEVYARLAISVYRLLQQQGEVDQLEETLNLKELSSGDDASTLPL
ncbi:MAG TPA: hypothetical protein VH144_00305 [Candidatus Saccharimonadales bacterium]|jgi:hypothetical protein|nr:hypothetical protein [Candidatus Saccharimonadales bacterium]